MLRGAADVLERTPDAIVIGPGLGTGETGAICSRGAPRLATPLVIDADALTLIAADAALSEAVCAKRSDGRYAASRRSSAACRRQDVGHPGEPGRSRADAGAALNPASSSKAGQCARLSRRKLAINSSGNLGPASGGTGRTSLPACSARAACASIALGDAPAAGRVRTAPPPMRWSPKAPGRSVLPHRNWVRPHVDCSTPHAPDSARRPRPRYGSNMVAPLVLRDRRSRCACAASLSA
jgi:hypothetical protein